MNSLLDKLQPYPFERLKQLFAGIMPSAQFEHINLGIGEPKHETPNLIKHALVDAIQGTGLATYPATKGEDTLRAACAQWVYNRYGVTLNADSQILPINGSREALFSLTQVIIDSLNAPLNKPPLVLCPNPFYQIYEGATLLAGAQPYYVDADAKCNFAIQWQQIPTEIWSSVQLVFVCSPNNPTGAVMPLAEWKFLIEKSQQYGFVIASDECYSEIYCNEAVPPLGSLQVAQMLGLCNFKNLIMLTSLSKRSNVPGMRSGFVAGDASIIEKFLLYRTYHGSAMSPIVQHASCAAWLDEGHVQRNRALYRSKFEQLTPLLASVMSVQIPDAGFYLWAKVPQTCFDGSDTAFAQALYAQFNVTVLPGSYLSRQSSNKNTLHNQSNQTLDNPGLGYVRLALVANFTQCQQAIERIVQFVQHNTH